jgi:hypothetical protein
MDYSLRCGAFAYSELLRKNCAPWASAHRIAGDRSSTTVGGVLCFSIDPLTATDGRKHRSLALQA